MDIDDQKMFDSLFSSVKSQLLSNFNDDVSVKFAKWMNKKLQDTINDKKEKSILRQKKRM